MPSGFIDWEHKAVSVIIKIAIIVVVTLIVVRIFRYLWKKYSKKNTLHNRFLYNIVLILIYITGALFALEQIDGIDKVLTPLLAGSGIAALALSLAAQESLGNLINGMVLSIAKPFEVGDRIHLVNGNITGYVEDITLRHTIMRTFVNSRIIIPNSTINKDMIENSNYQEGRASGFVDVTITFDSDMDKAMEIMADVIGEHPLFLDLRSQTEKKTKPKIAVYVRDLTINGVALRSSMWTTSIDNNFEACSDARREIKKEFDRAGILLAQIPARPSGSKGAVLEEEFETSSKGRK